MLYIEMNKIQATGQLFQFLAVVPYKEHPANFRGTSYAVGKGNNFAQEVILRCNIYPLVSRETVRLGRKLLHWVLDSAIMASCIMVMHQQYFPQPVKGAFTSVRLADCLKIPFLQAVPYMLIGTQLQASQQVLLKSSLRAYTKCLNLPS